MMMAEYGIPFDHIENHWTEAQFRLMLRRMNERRRKEAATGSQQPRGGFNPAAFGSPA